MTSTTTIPTRVDADAAARLQEERVRILDVRTPAEFETVHIPGSYNVPLDLLSEHREELQRNIDEPVILVCGTGVRAGQAENQLRQAGFQQLSVMEGGITAWESNGHGVVRGREKWPIERQVRGAAGAIVLLGTVGGYLFWRPLTFLSMFVGGGLLFSALTNTCGMAKVLMKLPYNQSSDCDINEVLNQLSADRK